MELKQLDKEELTALYRNEMTADFPRSELKPLAAMLRLMDMGRYDPLAAIDGGETVGYAMMWLPQDRTGALLEYLGVLRGRRNGGLGGQILELLAARYGQPCGGGASLFTSAAAFGCWTTCAPCSGCGSTVSTGDRRPTTGRWRPCTGGYTLSISPRRICSGISSSPGGGTRPSSPPRRGWRRRIPAGRTDGTGPWAPARPSITYRKDVIL